MLSRTVLVVATSKLGENGSQYSAMFARPLRLGPASRVWIKSAALTVKTKIEIGPNERIGFRASAGGTFRYGNLIEAEYNTPLDFANMLEAVVNNASVMEEYQEAQFGQSHMVTYVANPDGTGVFALSNFAAVNKFVLYGTSNSNVSIAAETVTKNSGGAGWDAYAWGNARVSRGSGFVMADIPQAASAGHRTLIGVNSTVITNVSPTTLLFCVDCEVGARYHVHYAGAPAAGYDTGVVCLANDRVTLNRSGGSWYASRIRNDVETAFPAPLFADGDPRPLYVALGLFSPASAVREASFVPDIESNPPSIAVDDETSFGLGAVQSRRSYYLGANLAAVLGFTETIISGKTQSETQTIKSNTSPAASIAEAPLVEVHLPSLPLATRHTNSHRTNACALVIPRFDVVGQARLVYTEQFPAPLSVNFTQVEPVNSVDIEIRDSGGLTLTETDGQTSISLIFENAE